MVVGPSGAGKDTLIGHTLTAYSDCPRVRVARRVVTRPASAHEDHDSLSQAQFEAHIARGAFAVHWRAHGLSYGIRRAELDAAEDVILANVSRTVIEAGRAIAPNSRVVLVTAPPEMLAARIAARGRDAASGSRTARQGLDALAMAAADLVIVNDRSPEESAAVLIDLVAVLLDR